MGLRASVLEGPVEGPVEGLVEGPVEGPEKGAQGGPMITTSTSPSMQVERCFEQMLACPESAAFRSDIVL